MATPVIKHATLTGAAANPAALVDGPKWDATHTVTGLENVDNTSDLNKPISTATQAALDAISGGSHVVTANYTITTADVGKTVQCGTGSTGLFTLTLPAVAGFPVNARIWIKNGDTARGKLLSGFPVGFSAGQTILWPLGAGSIKIVNGAWVTDADPGPWYAPSAVTLNVDHSLGSDTTADGLGTGAGAFATIYHAYQMLQSVVKGPAGLLTTIQVLDTAFTETPPGAFIGAPASGIGAVIIQGNSASPSSCVWTTAGIIIDDGAVIGLRGFTTRNSGAGQTWVTVTKLGLMSYANMIWSTATTGTHMRITDGGVIANDGGTYQVGDATSGANAMSFHIVNLGGTMELAAGGTVNVPNALTFNTWYYGQGSGSNTNFQAPLAFTGTGAGVGSTGAPWNMNQNATGAMNGIVFPGAGTALATGACMDGVCASIIAGQMPALTGDVTTSAGAVATTIGANKVTRAMQAQGVARSVVGVTGNATANVADIQGTANQVLIVNAAGTALTFGAVPSAALSLTTASNILGADVALNNTGTYFDGPSMAQGTTGTWFASGTVTLTDTAGIASFECKLWDGTTVIATSSATTGGANFRACVPLSGIITNPAANIRISCKDISLTTGKILFNVTGSSKDSTITGIRIN